MEVEEEEEEGRRRRDGEGMEVEDWWESGTVEERWRREEAWRRD